MKIKTFEELLKLTTEGRKNEDALEIYALVQNIEAEFLEISKDEFRKRVKNILNTMKDAIKRGLNSSELSKSGLSGEYTGILKKSFSTGREFSLFSDFQRKVMLYSLASIEENARMGKIAACPTAGSSGIVPGVLIALGEELNLDDEILINALIVSGVIGEIISNKLALAGAVAGCQAECGAASSMAAGGAAYIIAQNSAIEAKKANEIIINASALAAKNILGLTCDPVAGLVEVPCVKRNVFMALHALTAAELSTNGIVSKIPMDDVVDAMKETGNLMASSLKESSEAGLAKTKSGISIENALKEKFNLS